MQGDDFYTVEEAARALKLTPYRIRQMLRDGELEGVPTQEGDESGWKIPVRVIPGRDSPPPVDRSESTTTGSERLSGPEDIRGEEEEPGPTPAQPDGAAENSREPTPHRVTVQEAARILQTSVDALLEAKDEVIVDLRDRVAFLEGQLEGRAEEIRRRDHIIAALTERIPPAIEAPDHEKPPRGRESTVEEPARVRSPSGAAVRRAHGDPGGAVRSGDKSRSPGGGGRADSRPSTAARQYKISDTTSGECPCARQSVNRAGGLLV